MFKFLYEEKIRWCHKDKRVTKQGTDKDIHLSTQEASLPYKTTQKKGDKSKHAGRGKRKATANEQEFRREEIYMERKLIIKHARKVKEKYDMKQIKTHKTEIKEIA